MYMQPQREQQQQEDQQQRQQHFLMKDFPNSNVHAFEKLNIYIYERSILIYIYIMINPLQSK